MGMKYRGRLKTAAEEVRSQRKKEKNRNKRNQMGKNARSKDVIGKEHEMYALTYGMMIGVQVSVGRQFQAEALLNDDHDAPSNDDIDNAKGNKNANSRRKQAIERKESSARMNLNAVSSRLNLVDFMNVEKYVFPLLATCPTVGSRMESLLNSKITLVYASVTCVIFGVLIRRNIYLVFVETLVSLSFCRIQRVDNIFSIQMTTST